MKHFEQTLIVYTFSFLDQIELGTKTTSTAGGVSNRDLTSLMIQWAHLPPVILTLPEECCHLLLDIPSLIGRLLLSPVSEVAFCTFYLVTLQCTEEIARLMFRGPNSQQIRRILSTEHIYM